MPLSCFCAKLFQQFSMYSVSENKLSSVYLTVTLYLGVVRDMSSSKGGHGYWVETPFSIFRHSDHEPRNYRACDRSSCDGDNLCQVFFKIPRCLQLLGLNPFSIFRYSGFEHVYCMRHGGMWQWSLMSSEFKINVSKFHRDWLITTGIQNICEEFSQP